MKQKIIRGRDARSIATSVEQAVQAGALAPGQPLPPIRGLAASLGVSPVTVAAAYRRLHARGLVVAAGRRGTRIRGSGPGARDSGLGTGGSGLGTGGWGLGGMLVADGLIDLATGNPDPALLPPLEPVLRALPPAPRLFGGSPLHAPLIAFAASELEADGIPARAMAVASGALDAIERLLREHVRPGDLVGVEDPTLPALLDLIDASGLLAQPIAIDGEGPRPDALEAAVAAGARAVIITPRAQNPTGAAITPARAAELARALRRRDEVLVIENDPCGPVAGTPAVTLCGGEPPHWAVVRSVSKFLGPDLRLAIVAGDERTIARVQRRLALGMRWVSHLLQQAAVGLWSDPAAGRRLARASDSYAQRRTAVVEALAAHGIAVAARSGFNLWIPVREETATVQALAARGWAVAAGERFRLKSGPGIRITISALPVEDAPRLAADCAEALRPSAAASA